MCGRRGSDVWIKRQVSLLPSPSESEAKTGRAVNRLGTPGLFSKRDNDRGFGRGKSFQLKSLILAQIERWRRG